MNSPILITGASQRVGLALALELAQAGHTVVSASRSVQPQPAHPNIVQFQADLCQAPDRQALIDFLQQHYDGLRAIIHNASLWLDDGLDNLDTMFRLHVEAPYHLNLALGELLAKVDEFVGMLDMIRGDSSHVVGEGVPRIHAKAAEMRRIYGRIDKLEAFVRMIGSSVARMEEQVAKAEAELGTFPRAFRRLLHTISVPALFRSAPSGPQRAAYEPPVLFRTEDHFPGCGDRPQL